VSVKVPCLISNPLFHNFSLQNWQEANTKNWGLLQ